MPKEYVERIARNQAGLFDSARKIYDLLGEFNYGKYEVFSHDGFKITIERIPSSVVESVFNSDKS